MQNLMQNLMQVSIDTPVYLVLVEWKPYKREAKSIMKHPNLPCICTEAYQPQWAIMSNEHYHADRTAISSTSVRKALKSPHAFYRCHVLDLDREETPAMKFGTAFHMAILEHERFREFYVVQPEFSGTGMRERKANWLAAQNHHAVILKQDEYDDLMGMMESVSNHAEAKELLTNSQTEQSGMFRDPDTGILCKFKADFLHTGHNVLGDVKTTLDCTHDAFSRTIFNQRYDIQLYMYCLGASLIMEKKIEHPVFLAIEKKAPYEVALYQADNEMMMKAERDYKKAMSLLKECLVNDSWPRYQQKHASISLPKYAFFE